MSVLHDWIPANLRTVCLTLVGTFLVQSAACAQPPFLPSITARDVFTEWEAMASPLAEITSELAVVASPRPFGMAGLSRACLAKGLPEVHSALAVSALSTSSISLLSSDLRYRFVPMDGYVMGLRTSASWMMVREFDNVFWLRTDVSAAMRIAEWTLAVGLDGMLAIGQAEIPSLRMGLTRDVDSIGLMIDVIITAVRPVAIRLATALALTERVSVRAALGSGPITIEWGIRMPISETADLAIDLRHADPLGMAAMLTIAMELP